MAQGATAGFKVHHLQTANLGPQEQNCWQDRNARRLVAQEVCRFLIPCGHIVISQISSSPAVPLCKVKLPDAWHIAKQYRFRV